MYIRPLLEVPLSVYTLNSSIFLSKLSAILSTSAVYSVVSFLSTPAKNLASISLLSDSLFYIDMNEALAIIAHNYYILSLSSFLYLFI